jgi:hypothetical protein
LPKKVSPLSQRAEIQKIQFDGFLYLVGAGSGENYPEI